MARFRLPGTRSSTRLLGVAVVVLALAGSGGIAYACSQGGGGGGCGGSLGNSGGGGCPVAGLVWTSPSTVTKPATVLCTVGGLGSNTLTVAASRLAPGQSCVFYAALENIGETAVSLTEKVTVSEPSGCPLFGYADNVPASPPAVIAPEHAFSFQGTISLSATAGNACEGAEATIEVTITGTESITTYSVTFSESGLPSGLTWTVTVNGVTEHLTTNGCTDSLTWSGLASGTYAYSIAGTPGWHQTTLPYSGTVVVSGGSVTEPTLLYTQVTYPVSFSESGLPSGLTWKVTFNGVTKGLTANGGTDTLTFAPEPNGTYAYSIAGNPGWHQSTLPYSGAQTINGAPLSVSVTYTQVTYAVTFTETGLSSGTSWSVTLNGATKSSTTSTITFTEPNGTYGYTVGTVPGYTASPSSGSVTVNGASAAVTVKFKT